MPSPVDSPHVSSAITSQTLLLSSPSPPWCNHLLWIFIFIVSNNFGTCLDKIESLGWTSWLSIGLWGRCCIGGLLFQVHVLNCEVMWAILTCLSPPKFMTQDLYCWVYLLNLETLLIEWGMRTRRGADLHKYQSFHKSLELRGPVCWVGCELALVHYLVSLFYSNYGSGTTQRAPLISVSNNSSSLVRLTILNYVLTFHFKLTLWDLAISLTCVTWW